jgi:hypothetical protein
MKVEVNRASSGTLYWRDGRFWQLDITPDHETTGGDVKAWGIAIRTVGKGNKYPLLIYRAPGSLPSFEALTQFSKVATDLFSAVAYWVVSHEAARTAKLVREVFLAGLPVEVFADEAAAVDWIEKRLALSESLRQP